MTSLTFEPNYTCPRCGRRFMYLGTDSPEMCIWCQEDELGESLFHRHMMNEPRDDRPQYERATADGL